MTCRAVAASLPPVTASVPRAWLGTEGEMSEWEWDQ